MTFMLVSRIRCGAAASLLAIAAPATVAAQDGALPSARDLVARYVEAIGGAEALHATASVHTVGSFAVATMGLTGDLKSFQMRPNKAFSRVSIAGLGEIRRGFDGTTGWSINPMEGPRLLEGVELQQIRDDSDMRAMLRDTGVISSMETVEKTEMNSQPCYRVKLVWKSGRETTDCYAVDGGLLVATTTSVESPMGRIDATSFYMEYKSFGPLRMASVMRQQLMGQEQTFTVKSIELGTVDPAVFELPPEIRALKK